MNLTTITLIAIGGALLIEGAVWAVFPAQMREMYRQMLSMPDRVLHMSGLASVAFGMVLLVFGVKLAGVL